jgi:hypothetical protein
VKTIPEYFSHIFQHAQELRRILASLLGGLTKYLCLANDRIPGENPPHAKFKPSYALWAVVEELSL